MKSIIICVCPDTTQKTVCRHGPQSRLLGFCLFGPLVSLLILFCAAETRTDSLLIFKKPLLIFMKHWKTRSNSLLIFMISTNFFCQPKILKKSLSRLIFFNFQSALEKINCDWFFSILEPMGTVCGTLCVHGLVGRRWSHPPQRCPSPSRLWGRAVSSSPDGKAWVM